MHDKMPNKDFIYQTLREVFPNDTKALIRLCSHGLSTPLGFEHPYIIQDLIGKKLSDKDFERVQLAYVLLSAYYFLMDAVVDDHLEDKLQSLYLTHLLALACQQMNEIISNNPKINKHQFHSVFYGLISENAKAIILENSFRRTHFSFSEHEEFESIVGRSNSSILLLEIVALITEAGNIDHLKEILRDFAFFVQLGDDLVDWRDDYNTKNYTTFLRELFSKHSRVFTEEELEEEIYLTTIFEVKAIKVIKGLELLLGKIGNESQGEYLRSVVEHHIAEVKTLMTKIIEIKIKT